MMVHKLQAYADVFLCEQLIELEKSIADGPQCIDRSDTKRTVDACGIIASDYQDFLRENILQHTEETDSFIRRYKIAIQQDTTEYKVLHRHIMAAIVKLMEVSVERALGRYDTVLDYNLEGLTKKANLKAPTDPAKLIQYDTTIKESGRPSSAWKQITDELERRVEEGSIIITKDTSAISVAKVLANWYQETFQVAIDAETIRDHADFKRVFKPLKPK